ncbi:MAG: sialidase family protein, partial [Planctomycetota bacterium]
KTADATGSNLWGDAERIAMAGAMVRGLPRCYFAYEFGTALEEPLITAFQATGTIISQVVPETLLTKPGATPNPGATPPPPDVDNIFLAAEHNTILAVWLDNRGQPNGSAKNNAAYANWSFDGGNTWNTVSTKVGTNTSTSWHHSKHDAMLGVAVDGPNFYVTWGDRFASRADHQQELQLGWSNDAGKTWNEKPLTSYAVGAGNVRAHGIVADNGRVVAIAETDEAARKLVGPGFPGTTITDIGLVNGLEVFVSQDAGKTFTSTFVNTPLSKSNVTDVDYPMIAMRGDIIHISFEESYYNQTVWDPNVTPPTWRPPDEDLSMVTSTDGGKTFSKPIRITQIGSTTYTNGKCTQWTPTNPSFVPPDVDVPRLAMMPRGEAVIGFRSNHVPVTPPTPRDRPFAAVVCPLLYGANNDISAATGGKQNLTLCAGVKHQGQAYLVVGSISGTTPGLAVGPVHIPLNPDLVTNLTIALANTPTFSNTKGNLDTDGRAAATIVVPGGVTGAVGLTLHFVYVLADKSNNLVLASNPARVTIQK